MAEYIDRDIFLSCERNQYCMNCKRRKNEKGKFVYAIGDAPCRACGIGDVLDDAEDFPAADVRPVVRGKWKPIDLTYGRNYYFCSACEETVDIPTAMGIPMFRYCPNCGADMRVSE